MSLLKKTDESDTIAQLKKEVAGLKKEVAELKKMRVGSKKGTDPRVDRLIEAVVLMQTSAKKANEILKTLQ